MTSSLSSRTVQSATEFVVSELREVIVSVDDGSPKILFQNPSGHLVARSIGRNAVSGRGSRAAWREARREAR